MTAYFRIHPAAVSIADLQSKPDVLRYLCAAMALSYDGLDADALLESMEERENLGSTGFGRGIAIPHARSADVSSPVAAVIRLENPVDFKATDTLPVDLVFGLVSPMDAGATHLLALAAISRMMRDNAVHEAFLAAADADAIYAIISNSPVRDAA